MMQVISNHLGDAVNERKKQQLSLELKQLNQGNEIGQMEKS
jgi:hypothetical protein